MDRLTDTTGQLFACGNSLCALEPKQMCSDCKYQHEANNKLAQYELINDCPDSLKFELERLQAENERLKAKHTETEC